MTHVILMTTTGVTTEAPSEALGQLQTTAELIKLARQIAVTATTALTGARYRRCIELIGTLADVRRRTRRVAAKADHPTHRGGAALEGAERRAVRLGADLTRDTTCAQAGGKAHQALSNALILDAEQGASPRRWLLAVGVAKRAACIRMAATVNPGLLPMADIYYRPAAHSWLYGPLRASGGHEMRAERCHPGDRVVP
jgi:hypothetical protein